MKYLLPSGAGLKSPRRGSRLAVALEVGLGGSKGGTAGRIK